MKTSEETIKATRNQLANGILVETGNKYVFHLKHLELYVRLNINPNDKSSIDDTFTLIGGSSLESRKYEQTKTVEDDVVEGDDYLDLVFTGLIPDLNYWLEIDPGKEGQPYFAIEDMTWNKLAPVLRNYVRPRNLVERHKGLRK